MGEFRISLKFIAFPIVAFRLRLVHGFHEGKERGNKNKMENWFLLPYYGWISFPSCFPFPSPNPQTKQALKGLQSDPSRPT